MEDSTISNELAKSIRIGAEFFETLCKPMADQFGKILGDQLGAYRLKNLIKIVEKSKGMLSLDIKEGNLSLHPLVGFRLIDGASWQADDTIQDMWAGLLISSLSENPSDNNLIFIDILKNITSTEAKVIQLVSQQSKYYVDHFDRVYTKKAIVVELDQFCQFVGCNDLEILESYFSHLLSLGLVEKGFGLSCGIHKNKETNRLQVVLKASPLLIKLNSKSSGWNESLKKFYDVCSEAD